MFSQQQPSTIVEPSEHDARSSRTRSAPGGRSVNGRYRGASRIPGFSIELRIDVDGPLSSHRISGDIFDERAGSAHYLGSFVVARPRRVHRRDGLSLSGRGSFSSGTATPWLEVWLPRAGAQTAQQATVSRSDRDGNAGPVYDCVFESPYFRSVELTQDREESVDPVETYSAGGKMLSITSSFEAAGLEVQTVGGAVVKTTGAGSDALWSDAELLAAMESRLGDPATREWAVWLLHAFMHERDRGSDGSRMVLGLMFDQRYRHGCAIFYRWLGGTSISQRREQLYTCVHEIGHAFNLHHCWRQSAIGPARPEALSWMNNPRGWPRGAEAFWHAFAFGFDAGELAHLRHGFLEDVAMGGKPYAPPSPDSVVPSRGPAATRAGLRLRIDAPRVVAHGLPISVRLQLSATTNEPQAVAPVLGPRPSTVDIIVRPPHRPAFVFEPLLRHCRQDAPVPLRAGDSPIRDHAFIHYGREGFTFEQPGLYELRARYVFADGSVVMSAPATTHVRPPASRLDGAAQGWLHGDEQGRLLSLMGSSARALRTGDDYLQELIERYPDHPSSAAACLVRATNAAREFKLVDGNGSTSVAARDARTARALFDRVFDVERLRRAADGVSNKAEAALAVDVALPRVGTRPHVPAVVDDFIRSRWHEITTQLVNVLF